MLSWEKGMIEFQLHDINNKLMLMMWHILKLQKEHTSVNFNPLVENVERVKDLVSLIYEGIAKPTFYNLEMVKISKFKELINNELAKLSSSYPLTIKNEIDDLNFHKDLATMIELGLVRQIMENIFDNSYKAESNTLIIRLIEVNDCVILEFIDNGSEKLGDIFNMMTKSAIPNGIGSNLMKNNALLMSGKITRTPRLDTHGMVVRLYLTSFTIS